MQCELTHFPSSLLPLARWNKIFDRFDANKDGKLQPDELRSLVKWLNKEREPTEEEMGFIYHAVKPEGVGPDYEMSRTELQVAAMTYQGYATDQDFIERTLSKYDTNHDGKLDRPEVVAMLTELNDGNPPLDEEVDYVFENSDWDHSGTLTRTEIKVAISAWYALVSQKYQAQQGCCLLL